MASCGGFCPLRSVTALDLSPRPRGTVRGTTRRIIPAQLVPSVRLPVPSVQLGRVQPVSALLLVGGFDLRNTAARLGHSGGGATTLRRYADPVPEVDRRAAAYLAKLTARSGAESG